MIELYTRHNCPACVEMKKILSAKNIEYAERIIGQNTTVAEIREKFPTATHVPILAVKRHVLGGVEELEALIKQNLLKHLES